MSTEKKAYQNTDDSIYACKYVYCSQHRRVHETGWCTVSVIDKIPLVSLNEKDANEEWEMKKFLLKIGG